MNQTRNKKNYRLYLYSNIIMSFAGGIFGPFYVLFIQQKGNGLENFGIAMGLLLIAQSLSAYFIGKYSDAFGRKPFFLAEGYISTITLLLYLFVQQTWQLYLLQIINGLTSGARSTAEISFLGDITEKKSRGRDIGVYSALTGIVAGLALIFGGYVVGIFGIEIIFILVGIASFISTTILVFMKEEFIEKGIGNN